MAAGVSFLEGVGLDAIQSRSAELVDRLRARLAGAPGVVDFTPTDPTLRTGIVAVAVDGLTDGALRDRLRAKNFKLRANRGPGDLNGVRICCAFFNTESEIDRVADEVRALAAAVAPVGARA
jgi:selenocysteine lyase/cysteine desulfurase